MESLLRRGLPAVLTLLLAAFLLAPFAAPVQAAEEGCHGEACLKIPDLDGVTFLGGTGGRSLLMVGLLVSALGFAFPIQANLKGR